MKKSVVLFVFSLCAACAFGQKKDQSIIVFGAVADGETNNAKVIQKAIDQVSATGGGRVIVPPGNFMTGTIFLKSGVDLHLELGARLLGSTNINDYFNDKGRALIMAKDQKNIALSGKGIVDGQGQELMVDVFKKLRSGEIKEKDSMWMYKRPEIRAKIVLFTKCNDIKINDITLKNSSNWVQDYVGCNNLVINGMTVQSTAYWNNDGLDITDSKNVKIIHCNINSTDDGICLKTDDPNGGCENVYIDSCKIRSSANGLKFGTSSAGGFRNIKVRNLYIYDTYRSAIAIECVDGGGAENIDIQNIVAVNTGNAIFIRRGHRNTDARNVTTKGIYIANVKVEVSFLKPDQGYPIEGPPDHLHPGYDKMPVRPSSFHIYGHPYLPYNLIPSSIVGIPGYPVQDVTLENIEISFGGHGSKDIANIPLTSITSIPENEAGYPDFSMWGELPAWGFYVRHADGIKMKNVIIKYLADDFRPAFVFDDAKSIDLTDVNITTAKEMPVVLFNNASNITTKNLKLPVSEASGVMKTNYK